MLDSLVTSVVVEGRKDEAVVFPVNFEDGVDVDFGFGARVSTTRLDGGNAPAMNVGLEKRLKFAQPIGDAGYQLDARMDTLIKLAQGASTERKTPMSLNIFFFTRSKPN